MINKKAQWRVPFSSATEPLMFSVYSRVNKFSLLYRKILEMCNNHLFKNKYSVI